MKDIDPALARALDRLEPPAMSDDFTSRVLAAAEGQAAAPAKLPKLRPASRGLWRRSRNLVVGVAALSLVSAAAAATGLLGEKVQDLPVIAAIAARIAPHHKAERAKPRLAQPLAPAATTPVPPENAPDSQAGTAGAASSIREARREAVGKWLDERREQRVALGLPTASPQKVAAVRERLAEMSPAQRRAVIDRAIARREARGALVPDANNNSATPLRDAIRQRREASAASPAQQATGAGQPAATPLPDPSPTATATGSEPVRQQQPAAERLRQLREHRREMRRQRGT